MIGDIVAIVIAALLLAGELMWLINVERDQRARRAKCHLEDLERWFDREYGP